MKHYFDDHRIIVTTSFPLGDILRNKDTNGRIVKWAMELCPFSMDFQSRTTVKSQALADFIAEWTDLNAPPAPNIFDHWLMFFDGSLNINDAGAGILFVPPNKDKLHYVLRILFPASNNVAEYEACLHGIRLAMELGVKRLYVHGDSALVINQLNKEWETTHEKMDLYCKEIRVDIWERNKKWMRKRTDIGEHFTREVIQSIVFIFLPLGERVHLTNRSITTNPLGNKECLSM